jgi:hypothetical protein
MAFDTLNISSGEDECRPGFAGLSKTQSGIIFKDGEIFPLSGTLRSKAMNRL